MNIRAEKKSFRYLECDLIVGNRSDEKVSFVMKAFDDLKNLFGENFDKIFHSLTTDNGSESSHSGKSRAEFNSGVI